MSDEKIGTTEEAQIIVEEEPAPKDAPTEKDSGDSRVEVRK